MNIGFIGLGKMGFPMARRLIEAKHHLVVFDQRKEAVDKLVALGAEAASSPKDVADRAETVMASLPSLQASLEVATGKDGVIEGKLIKRFVDLSTVGSHMAVRIHDLLAKRNIVQLDSPVSGGVGGAEKGTLAVMVSGPKADFEAVKPALAVIGKVFFIGEKPGSAQTMKLANNFLSATAMVATSEAVVMGVKSGLDPAVMIDVINSGSGLNTASRDKFPRSVLPRSFDFGFATGLMVKDVRLCLEEMKALGLSMEVAEAVGRLWEVVIREMGAGVRFHRGDQADRKSRRRGGRRRKRQPRREVRHVPRMLRSAPPFAAWCAADPGPAANERGSRLCGAVRSALHRVRDTTNSQPRRGLVHRDQRLDLDARAHHRVLVVLDQHFRHQRPGVVGAGLHRAVGARGHDRQEIAGLGLGQLAVEREIIAGFADRTDHVGGDDARALGGLADRQDVVMRLVQRRADQIVHRGIDDDEILGVAGLHDRSRG